MKGKWSNSFLHLFCSNTACSSFIVSLRIDWWRPHVLVNSLEITSVFFLSSIASPMNSISNKVSMKRKSFKEAHVIPFFDSECRQMHSVPNRSEETLFSCVQEIVQEGGLQNRKGNNCQQMSRGNHEKATSIFFFNIFAVFQNTLNYGCVIFRLYEMKLVLHQRSVKISWLYAIQLQLSALCIKVKRPFSSACVGLYTLNTPSHPENPVLLNPLLNTTLSLLETSSVKWLAYLKVFVVFSLYRLLQQENPPTRTLEATDRAFMLPRGYPLSKSGERTTMSRSEGYPSPGLGGGGTPWSIMGRDPTTPPPPHLDYGVLPPLGPRLPRPGGTTAPLHVGNVATNYVKRPRLLTDRHP